MTVIQSNQVAESDDPLNIEFQQLSLAAYQFNDEEEKKEYIDIGSGLLGANTLNKASNTPAISASRKYP